MSGSESASAWPKGIKRDLRHALDRWLPKRQETVRALEELADVIQYRGKIANFVKLGGNAVGAVAGAVSGTLGVATILATGGLATPFVVCGAVAAGAGVVGAVTAGGAEVTKSVMFSRLLKEAQNKINQELDEYLTVIWNLERMYKKIIDKSKVDQPSQLQPWTAASRHFCDAAFDLLAAYSNALNNHFTKVAGQAATKAAITAARETTEVTTEALAKVATDAAEKATNTTVGLLVKEVSQNSTDAIIAAAGKKAGEAVLEAVEKGLAEEVALVTVETATVSAAKSAAKTALKESVQTTGDVIPAAGGWLSWIGTTFGKTAGKALPLLNFGFAIWDAAESVKAGVDIAWGSQEETKLKEKIRELKDEGNKIVNDIYNHFFGRNNDQMVAPFPNV